MHTYLFSTQLHCDITIPFLRTFCATQLNAKNQVAITFFYFINSASNWNIRLGCMWRYIMWHKLIAICCIERNIRNNKRLPLRDISVIPSVILANLTAAFHWNNVSFPYFWPTTHACVKFLDTLDLVMWIILPCRYRSPLQNIANIHYPFFLFLHLPFYWQILVVCLSMRRISTDGVRRH